MEREAMNPEERNIFNTGKIVKRGFLMRFSFESIIERSRKIRIVGYNNNPTRKEMRAYRRAVKLRQKLIRTGLWVNGHCNEDYSCELDCEYIAKPKADRVYGWAETYEEYLERMAEAGLEPLEGEDREDYNDER